MNLFTSILLFTAGGCLIIGLIYLVVGSRIPRPHVHLWLGIMAILATVKAVVEVWMYGVATPETYATAMKWQLSVTFLWAISLTWFIASYVRGLRRISIVVSTGFLLAIVANVFSTDGLVFTRVTELRQVTLPWGEEIAIGYGPVDPLRVILDGAGLAFIVLTVAGCVQLVRQQRRRQAVLLGASLGVILIAGLVHGLLVDLGIVELPYLVTPAILILVLILSVDLGSQVVSKFTLSRAIVASEERWRSLLERAQLLIAVVDRHGKIELINPYFAQTADYTTADVAGKHFIELVSPQDREKSLRLFNEAMNGRLEPSVEASIVSASGKELMVVWSSVLLRDENEQVTGVLSVGADITERRRAEAARDEALRNAEALRRRLEEENVYLKQEVLANHGSTRLLGNSPGIAKVHSRIAEVAPTEATVLIEGETGVGKELVAHLIHETGPNPRGPFIRLNCTAMPKGLVESELFGHEKGSFTGAEKFRRGRFELADNGTLFLDEIGDLPLDIQPKLLRALQDGEINRVGGSDSFHVNVRVITATNRSLSDRVASGHFREDLYYRLAVYPIVVPPLRDRKEDIPQLVEHFVLYFSARHGKRIGEIPTAVLQQLSAYSWPGNVRELMNVLERSVISCPDHVLRLATRLTPVKIPDVISSRNGDGRLPTLEEFESGYLREVLESTKGRINGPGGAAEVLGIHPSTLRSRLTKLGLRR